ncbi:MAG: CaiB/BaiF CoA transferase family protein [Kiloniellaceae bacterium]
MTGALDGILVVSLEQAVAAPYCSSRLADAGARVIKVERPEGDFARGYDRVVAGESAYFVWLNRGKESVALDIKDPADRALLERMLLRADVFVQNLMPGAAARAGFDADRLRRGNPGLVTCDISGYGEAGPYARMKAYDLLVQAESGLAAVTGRPEGPGRVGVSVCDIAAGMYATMAILEALIARRRDGRGRGIKISLFDAMADWMTVPLLYQVYGGQAPERLGLNHPSIAPYGAYRTGGGGEVVISIQNEREWARFCAEVLKQPELATDPRFADIPARVANRADLDRAIEAVFGALTRDRVVARLRTADIAYGALNTVADLAAHPQLRRTEVAIPGGTAELVAAPARLSEGTPAIGPVPALDAHGAAIRLEFAP